MIFDSHAHYNDDAFLDDQDILLRSMNDKGIKRIVNVAANLDSIDEILELTEKYDFMYGALGIHPSDSEPLTEALLQNIKDKCANPKIRAIGEIGLDYHYDEPGKDIQKHWFNRQLDLAEELKMSVIIHSREACKDTMDILKPRKNVTGIIHCFSYTKETAKEYIDMGYVIGVGGVVTFKNSAKLKETVEYIPLDKIVLETDCPYLAPTPHRGERNDSGFIPLIIEEIARLKNVSYEEVEETCWNTTNLIYGIN